MTEEYLTQFRHILTEHNCHYTKAREMVFRMLTGPSPQTMRELLVKTQDRVDRVSVYRTVELFEKLGIINRVYTGWKYKLELSDQFMAHHHHLLCLNCGKVIDIKDEQSIEEFIEEVSEKLYFKPVRHQFEIEGYCQNCQ